MGCGWLAGGWVGGWFHQNNATSWLHLASWYLLDFQLCWESKIEPSVTTAEVVPSSSWVTARIIFLLHQKISHQIKSQPAKGGRIISSNYWTLYWSLQPMRSGGAKWPCHLEHFWKKFRYFNLGMRRVFKHSITLPVCRLKSSPWYLFRVKIFQAVKLMLTTLFS